MSSSSSAAPVVFRSSAWSGRFCQVLCFCVLVPCSSGDVLLRGAFIFLDDFGRELCGTCWCLRGSSSAAGEPGAFSGTFWCGVDGGMDLLVEALEVHTRSTSPEKLWSLGCGDVCFLRCSSAGTVTAVESASLKILAAPHRLLTACLPPAHPRPLTPDPVPEEQRDHSPLFHPLPFSSPPLSLCPALSSCLSHPSAPLASLFSPPSPPAVITGLSSGSVCFTEVKPNWFRPLGDLGDATVDPGTVGGVRGRQVFRVGGLQSGSSHIFFQL